MKRPLLIMLPFLGAHCLAYGGEVIPAVASYEPPAFLRACKPGSASSDPYSGAVMAMEYLANDNAGGSPHRQLNIGMQSVGFTIGEGKRITWNPVTVDEIKKLMFDRASKRATNVPKVETIQFAGRKAYKVSCHRGQGHLAQNGRLLQVSVCDGCGHWMNGIPRFATPHIPF